MRTMAPPENKKKGKERSKARSVSEVGTKEDRYAFLSGSMK